MILADENIDYRIIKALRDRGIETLSVFEKFRGAGDETVIEIAQDRNLIILTEDKDFGEWAFAHQKKNISVILLRYHFLDTMEIINILLNLLDKKNVDLYGNFTTITKQKIRIRKL